MNLTMKRDQFGFTLIELMIVVVIVGIIAKFAYPSYVENLRRGKRAEVKAALMENAQFMERFFTENASYGATSASLPRTQTPTNATGTKVNYNITVTSVAASGAVAPSFQLYATPSTTGTMASDSCKVLSVNNLGQRVTLDSTSTSTANANSDTCWNN